MTIGDSASVRRLPLSQDCVGRIEMHTVVLTELVINARIMML